MPGIRVTGRVDKRISSDGRTALLIVEITELPGKPFAITMDTPGLGPFMADIQDLRIMALARGLHPGPPDIREPTTFQVGHSAARRGYTFLTFDEGLPSEITIATLDQNARQLAMFIERDVLSRMTPGERRAAARQARPLLLPNGGGKLILPGE